MARYDGSFVGLEANQASSISSATGTDVARRLKQRTLASFHSRAPAAVAASLQSAARAPETLLAEMLTPVPVQQQSTP